LIGIGYADKIMISHHKIVQWLGRFMNIPEEAPPFIADWHLTHLMRRIIPALKQGGVADKQMQTILADNPRRLFGAE
jgi:phosphotriesterase-related protein